MLVCTTCPVTQHCDFLISSSFHNRFVMYIKVSIASVFNFSNALKRLHHQWFNNC